MAKLTWRLKLVAELDSSVASETVVAQIEREDFAVPATLGLTLDEGKALVAAVQAKIVRAQAAVLGERFRWCEHCAAKLLSKGYYHTTFRSRFGDVRLKVRRLRACPCQAGMSEARSFAALLPMVGLRPSWHTSPPSLLP